MNATRVRGSSPDEYVARISNQAKRDYATRYLAAIRLGVSPEISYVCSYMAAHSVRVQLASMGVR